VDVDVELGLVKVVEIVTAQDVGKAINPDAVLGQIHAGRLRAWLGPYGRGPGGGGTGPEPLVYRLPDPDHPRHAADARRCPRTGRPERPYGLRGVGEAPTISSTPAIVAAVRAATGRALTRVPVRPEDITGTAAVGEPVEGAR